MNHKGSSGRLRAGSNSGADRAMASKPSMVSVTGPSHERFNEPNYHGLAPSQQRGGSTAASAAFGSKAPSQAPKASGKPKPPLMPKSAQNVDGFNRKEWIRELKLMQKDVQIEERDRLRPLFCSRREFQEFIMECEK